VLDTKSPKYLEMAQGHISLSVTVFLLWMSSFMLVTGHRRGAPYLYLGVLLDLFLLLNIYSHSSLALSRKKFLRHVFLSAILPLLVHYLSRHS
jgi:hypothetical protein